MKINASDIQRAVMNYVQGGNDVIVPNYYYGMYECDVFKVTPAGIVSEYEIKISKEDYLQDFKKNRGGVKKHERMLETDECPNKFYFVYPAGMVEVATVPKYAGVLVYERGSITCIRPAKRLHKRNFTKWDILARNLSFRFTAAKQRVKKLQNGGDIEEIRQLNAIIRSQEAKLKDDRTLVNLMGMAARMVRTNPERLTDALKLAERAITGLGLSDNDIFKGTILDGQ